MHDAFAMFELKERGACSRSQWSSCCRAAADEEPASSERGEGWEIEAEASPLAGDALEERLSEQVEEGAAGTNSEIAQTCQSSSHSPRNKLL